MLLPPCPQHQEVISGSRRLMWPQIQEATARTGRDPCSENIVPTHWDRAGKRKHTGIEQGKAENCWLHPWAQLWPPSRPVWPAKTTIHGRGVEKAVGLHSPHPPGNFVLCRLWWLLTKEICHQEGTGATSGSSRAPERDQWDRHKTLSQRQGQEIELF